MIVRKQPNGELILIGQTDHSRLVGQLAAHWGNENIAAPKPYASLVRAATFHDYGWLRYETSPLIHPETGEPYQFLQVPLGAEQLASYQWSLDWLAGIDRYAGLIISMHRTGLWKNRYETIAHPGGYNLRELTPLVKEFIARNEAWQERERASCDADGLQTNYTLMQIWDLLGLYFCCQEPYEDYVEARNGLKITMKPAGAGRVAFDPFPFSERPCRIQLAYKRLRRSSFDSVEEFQTEYFKSENELLRFELV